jgi:iron(III) transport system substrate-binding protein
MFESVAPELRDPDRTWVAMSFQSAMIGRTANAPDVVVSSYADLGKSELAGQLCLSSSRLSPNRVLIGMLIEDLGVRPAERVVRSWVRNLALPPFSSEAELHDALERGDCSYAISSAFIDGDFLTVFRPDPVYVDIAGIGVARHAPHPDAAQDLVDWILSELPEASPPLSKGHNVGIAGWRDEEARLLAERAGYW